MQIGRYARASVGILRFDLQLSSADTFPTYLHVPVVAEGFAPLTQAAWHKLVETRYGSNVEDRIRGLYEELSRVEKADGREQPAPLEFSLDDVAAVLDREEVPPTITGTHTARPV